MVSDKTPCILHKEQTITKVQPGGIGNAPSGPACTATDVSSRCEEMPPTERGGVT